MRAANFYQARRAVASSVTYTAYYGAIALANCGKEEGEADTFSQVSLYTAAGMMFIGSIIDIHSDRKYHFEEAKCKGNTFYYGKIRQ